MSVICVGDSQVLEQIGEKQDFECELSRVGFRHEEFTVHVYPGGAHSLRLTASGLIREEQTSPGFVAGVFSDLAAWLRSRVRSR